MFKRTKSETFNKVAANMLEKPTKAKVRKPIGLHTLGGGNNKKYAAGMRKKNAEYTYARQQM
jgi:hypothetical protein